jgi:hypothetical protein
MRKQEAESDFERAPNSKIRVVATVCSRLCDEMKRIHDAEAEDARNHDRTIPDWSNTVEMLLRKGAKAYRNKGNPEAR